MGVGHQRILGHRNLKVLVAAAGLSLGAIASGEPSSIEDVYEAASSPWQQAASPFAQTRPSAPSAAAAFASTPQSTFNPGRSSRLAARGGSALVARSERSAPAPAAKEGSSSSAGGASPTPTAPCSLLEPGADRTRTEDCMTCHQFNRTHSVDVDYGAAAARAPELYRPPDEAIRRGVFLPDGQIKCLTCHDPGSRWKYKIALPPGAAAPAVDRLKPQTYERPPALAAPLPPGSAVSPTPLCQSCHTFGD